MLTPSQERVFEAFKKFLSDEDEVCFVLNGQAGVGKSFLTKYFVEYIHETSNKKIIACCPTHKARRVLEKLINQKHLKVITIASLLSKTRKHSCVGTKNFSSSGDDNDKLKIYDIFIIDEVSMVLDSDLERILDFCCENDKKILLIGDICQVPSPTQKFRVENNTLIKKDSCAFDILNCHTLTDIVRQKTDNPVLILASFYRDNLNNDVNITDLRGVLPSSFFLTDLREMYLLACQDILAGKDVKIICYTNLNVKKHNLEIRKNLNYNTPLVVGEVLTSYADYPVKSSVITNGTDYIVKRIEPVFNESISIFRGLAGNRVFLTEKGEKNEFCVFFINISHKQNKTFLTELIRRARILNQPFSKRNDYFKYLELKDGAVFLENLYYHLGKIYNETDFKNSHPLLFHKVIDVVNSPLLQVYKDIEKAYPDIIFKRKHDDKIIVENEIFADGFMVVEKDLFYGYSITSHKTQGSTYESVFVDDADFNRLKNMMNYRFGKIENRTREKNQLRYVAYTRTSDSLRVLVEKMEEEKEN